MNGLTTALLLIVLFFAMYDLMVRMEASMMQEHPIVPEPWNLSGSDEQE